MRQPFRCIRCGLRLAGRPDAGGRVHVYDKSPTADVAPQPCVCATCAEARAAIAEAR